ncbi:MAG: CYTH domain-containing protein [Planctomycetota bacterium]|jgi:CYTH domain-containing protein
MEDASPGASPLEIERKFLLDRLPALPDRAEPYRMEQGYLADGPGRLRRAVGPDGAPVCTLTVKTGLGLVRREDERTISEQEFRKHWPRTAGRRLTKTRYRIEQDGLVWEIDRYDGLDLVLAEVELPSADTEITVPDWLQPHVVREVTDEPQFQNYEIALRMAARRMTSGESPRD